MRKLLATVAIALLSGMATFSQTTITVGGTARNMIVYAPANLGTNRPLVISLHGMNQDAPYQQSTAKWELVADTAKFVVVYPNGLNKSWDISGTTDLNFITAIINEMFTKYGIDKSRVYLTGFSMGGMMTYHAANNIADKIAAFGPVSGYMSTKYTSSRPIPIIHTHGTADDVVPYAAGNSGSTGAYFPGAEAIAKGWATRNNCSATPVTTTPYPAGTSNTNSKKVWASGDCGTEVALISITGKGHWHSNDPAGVYTTTEIWKFVRRYSTSCGTLSATSVAITSPLAGAALTAPASVTITATAAKTGGTISKVEFYNGTTKLGEDASSPYSYSWTSVAAGTYSITAVATDNAGNKTTSAAVALKVNPAQAPYSGTPAAVPGIIQFENYDLGGNGFAYADSAATNTGGATFRTDEDVDIENCTDAGAGYNLGFTEAGEWMEYTVNVAAAGKYTVTFRAASNGAGKTVSLSAKDKVVAADIAIPNTAGWQTWEDVVVKDIALEAGVQVLRLTIGAADYVNLNYMAISAQAAPVQSIQLKAGWNIIGCPIAGSTPVADALTSVWANVVSVKDVDSFYNKSYPAQFNKLTELAWGKGYMVKVDKDCELVWAK